jgi:maltose alpha-D-glucosyltransferase/alpha-amylase
MRNLAGRVLGDLANRIDALPEDVREQAARVLALEDAINDRFRAVTRHRSGGYRIRCHGDYHLGQLLFTGRDFVITDFEGEPIRPLGERRLKRSPLRDVAGMLRSFHYAAHAALVEPVNSAVRIWDDGTMADWADVWTATVGNAFTGEYMATAADAGFLPDDPDDTAVLLDACLLEKAVYELGYEMNNRPSWTTIPLAGILALLGEGSSR